MPIGNGEVGLNVWVEEGGDLLFLVSRTDAWSETCRLLKLGRVRVHLEPNPFATDVPFRQTLALRSGNIEIEAGRSGEEVRLLVSVDSDRPVVRVVGESAKPLRVTASLECWRNERHVLKGEELQSSWTMHDAPASVEVWESPDRILDEPAAVAWCHFNDHSVVPETLAHQGLSSAASSVRDPLLHRAFGGWMIADGFAKSGKRSLVSKTPLSRFEVRLAALTEPDARLETWAEFAKTIADTAPDPVEAARSTRAWWESFWARSWIFAGAATDRPPALPPGARELIGISQAYQLQRFVQACGGRGAYPIKFNGSIFTVDPKFTGAPGFDPDWRRWGGDFWWQNTRLPYHPMLAAGDFEMMEPLFRLYRDALPLCEARARIYHGVRGAYFPETMTIFGTYSNGDYGWDRTGHEPKDVLCPWWQYAWNQGPELAALMLDRYEYTREEKFLQEEVLPLARAVIDYFDTRFSRDERGKLAISPTQALETHWHDVVDDAPSVAGLHAVLARLSALPASVASEDDRARWKKLEAELPPVPTAEENGVRFLSAAGRFEASYQNCETPELYAVFPFRLFGVGKDGIELAREAYARRKDRLDAGWPQDGENAALLGLTDEARRLLLAKIANGNRAHRFPAMWGPNFDWLPDQDHGSNLMETLQLMLLQCDGDAIRILPAWPANWDVHFRLHAPRNTTVEVDYRRGEVVKLEVTPASRRADVIAPTPRSSP
jgi:hypothetical protein